MTAAIAKAKRDLIRSDFLGERIEAKVLAEKLGIDRTTVNLYRRCFEVIRREYPDKLHDYSFCLMPQSLDKKRHQINREAQLIALLPEIMDSVSYKAGISLKPLYAAYKSRCPNGYARKPFVQHLFQWRKENNICNYHHLRIKQISQKDLETLTNWKKRHHRCVKVPEGSRYSRIVQWQARKRSGSAGRITRSNHLGLDGGIPNGWNHRFGAEKHGV
jgi:hypothetical protein